MPLKKGYLPDVSLVVTFASAPGGGSVKARVVLEGPGAADPAPFGGALFNATPILKATNSAILQIDNSAGYRTAQWVLSTANILSDPTSALTLAQAAGSSSFTAAETVHVLCAFITAAGSTSISPDASIDIATAGNDITTSVTLPYGATGADVFVGTTSGALELASVAADGTITYSGGLSAGLAVTVNGSILSLTISAAASGTGAAQPTSNTSTPATATLSVVNFFPDFTQDPVTHSWTAVYNSGSSQGGSAGVITITGLPWLFMVAYQASDSLLCTLDFSLGY